MTEFVFNDWETAEYADFKRFILNVGHIAEGKEAYRSYLRAKDAPKWVNERIREVTDQLIEEGALIETRPGFVQRRSIASEWLRKPIVTVDPLTFLPPDENIA